MKTRRLLGTLGCVVGTALLATTVAQAQDPFILDTRGDVEVWSVPQPAPGAGYEATQIVLRSVDPAGKLVTFENLRFDGEIVQTWLSGPFAAPTAKGAPTAGPTYDASWVPYDSHVLIRDNDPNMVGGGAGGSYGGITEDNDGSIGAIPGLPDASGFPPNSGIGSIFMGEPTDAFFLDTAFQANEVNLAYLVGQSGAGAADGHVTMTLGVLGEGIINSGEAGGAQWGFGENPDPLGIEFSQGPVEPAVCIAEGVACIELLSPGDGISGGQNDGTNFNVGVAGTAADVNNWPAGEPPESAIDGVGQKYLNFGKTDTGFVVTPSVGATTVGGIKLWAANDSEPRDPASYQVWGTNADVSGDVIPMSEFTPISVGDLSLPSSRNAGGDAPLLEENSQTVLFLNDTEYSSYLVLFPGVKDAAAANSMQIAEVQLLGVPEPGSVSLFGMGALMFLGMFRRRK